MAFTNTEKFVALGMAPELAKTVSDGIVDSIRDKSEILALVDLTDSTTGTASDTLAATVGIQTVAIPLQLASMTTSAADLMTAYTPGYAFELLSLEFVTTTLGTGASASHQP